MTIALRHPSTFFLVFFIVWSGKVLAYEVDPTTYLKLPKSCQSWFILAPSINRSWRITGTSFAGMKPPIQLKSALGPNVYIWMNHYCPALVSLVRFKERDNRNLEPEKRNRHLLSILNEVEYQLKHASWSKSDLWFKAEVLRNKGHILRLMEKSSDAVAAFNESIEAHQSYLPAYWELASVFEESRRYQEAIRTLEDALQYTRKQRARKKINDQIDKIRKAADDPGGQQEAHSPTTRAAPAEAGNSTPPPYPG